MLHAGVLLKIGAYGLIRLGLDAVPAGVGRLARCCSRVIGVINVVYGAFCAMSQTDLKYVIGYSSVSHMGYVLLGLAIGDRFGLTGAVFQMFAHGIMTGLFFALIGFIYEQTHTRADRRHHRPDAAHAARGGVLRHRGRVEHGPAVDRRLRRRAARLRRPRHRSRRGSPPPRSSASSSPRPTCCGC